VFGHFLAMSGACGALETHTLIVYLRPSHCCLLLSREKRLQL
jgi:hypothetical protein